MEFKIAQPEIETCLQRAQGFINTKGANPILSNIKITATGNEIEVFATDYDVGLKGSYAASVVEEGTLTLNGKMIYDIVRQLKSDDEVHFRHVGAGRCEVSCGKSHFKLATIDPDEFPEMPECDFSGFINIDAEMFKGMLWKTAYAASQNESRMTLNGTFCDFRSNSMKVVATDGHRLAFAGSTVDITVKDPMTVIIPRKSVMELLKILGEEEGGVLQVLRSGNRLFFKKDSLLFFSREVEGSFPNYEQVIPKKNTKVAQVDIALAKQAIKRVATVASEKSHLVHLQFKKDKMEIFAEASEIGEAHEEIEIEYDGDSIKIGLNSAYLLDAFNHIASEKAVLKMEKPLDAVLIKPANDEDYISIIMPMRI